MKIPTNTYSYKVAHYMGISTLGRFKSILALMSPCAKLFYYENGFKGVRVSKLLKELN